MFRNLAHFCMKLKSADGFEEKFYETLDLVKLHNLTKTELDEEINEIESDPHLPKAVKDHVIGFARLSSPAFESKEMEDFARSYNTSTKSVSTALKFSIELLIYCAHLKTTKSAYDSQIASELLTRCGARGGHMALHNYGFYIIHKSFIDGKFQSELEQNIFVAIALLNAIDVNCEGFGALGEMDDLATCFTGKYGFPKDSKERTYWSNKYSLSKSTLTDETHNLEQSLISKWTASTDIKKDILSAVKFAEKGQYHKAAQAYYNAAEITPHAAAKLIYYQLAMDQALQVNKPSSLRLISETLHALRKLIEINITAPISKPEELAFRTKLHDTHAKYKNILNAKLQPQRDIINKTAQQEALRTVQLREKLGIIIPKKDVEQRPKATLASYASHFQPAEEHKAEKQVDQDAENADALSALDSLAKIVSSTTYKA